MSDITDYILAKQTLAQLDVHPFGDSQMGAVDTLGSNRVYSTWTGASTFALPNLDVVSVIPIGSRGTGYVESCLKFIHALQGVFALSGTLSDSQQLSRRDQRARDIRAVNMRAEVPLARIYDFEKPFPEERSYNPQIPETPKILKLRK